MFLRTKEVKGNNYLYAVENTWKKKKGVKQKVKKYLGRVHNFRESKKKVKFEEFLDLHYNFEFEEYLDNNESDRIVSDLVRWELYKKGFSLEGDGRMKRKKLIVNANHKRDVLKYDGRPFSIKSGEGFLNNFSINAIMKYKLNVGGVWEGDIDKKKVGMKLARMFVDGGIKIPQEVFISLFEKKFLD